MIRPPFWGTMENQPANIAHRGASGTAPENTIRAFEQAAQDGADMIELDVWATADDVLIVFHDDTTDRWNGVPDAVANTTWERLQQVRLQGEPIPTLEEVCAWARRKQMPLNVEIKAPGFEAAVVALLERYGLANLVIVSSFYLPVLQTVRLLAPNIPRGVLTGSDEFPTDDAEAWLLSLLAEHAATAWHPGGDVPALDQLVPAVQDAGYAVNVWTINEPGHLEYFIALGVDGIITNYPARLSAILESL